MFRPTKILLRCGLQILAVASVAMAMSFQGVAAQDADDMGVFVGDFVGCKDRGDLIDYYDADFHDNRTITGKLVSSGKCFALDGRTYIPLRTGFVISAVEMKIRGERTVVWARTQALVASPPPARESHFNF